MSSFTQIMHQEHQRCDQIFATGEEQILAGQLETGKASLSEFIRVTTAHFVTEEDLLFPAFEAHTGMTHGPTQVMRMEHNQMRSLFDQLNKALAANQSEQAGSVLETLMILMQQHNLKEEQILYPMMDNHLGHQRAELIEKAKEMLK